MHVSIYLLQWNNGLKKVYPRSIFLLQIAEKVKFIKRGANENNHFESIRITDFLLGKKKRRLKKLDVKKKLDTQKCLQFLFRIFDL